MQFQAWKALDLEIKSLEVMGYRSLSNIDLEISVIFSSEFGSENPNPYTSDYRLLRILLLRPLNIHTFPETVG